ncbi:MAG: GTP-binding protein [Oscillospiraceae bacterium]|jgi:small GTP-binding protein|nr:GTP-binding protein [Oscillospiraceae bacterium]
MKFKNMILGALAFIFMVPTPAAKGAAKGIAFVKVIFLGNAGVGKTTLLNKIVGKPLSGDHHPTVGVNYVRLTEEDTALDIWDTAGQERYRSIALSFVRNSKIVVIVFSVDDTNSFGAIVTWLSLLRGYVDIENIKFILVANKTDLKERLVAEGEIQQKAESLGMPVYFCSAKTGEGVDELKGCMFNLAKEIPQKVTCSLETEELHENEDKKCC